MKSKHLFLVMLAVCFMVSVLITGANVSATNIGELENGLRVGNVRPILIWSDENINVYITGMMIKSLGFDPRKITKVDRRSQGQSVMVDRGSYNILAHGPIIFEYKNEAFRKEVITHIQDMLNALQGSKKANEETGRFISIADTEESILFGIRPNSLIYWAPKDYMTKLDGFSKLQNFRFLSLGTTWILPYRNGSYIWEIGRFKYDSRGNTELLRPGLSINERLLQFGIKKEGVIVISDPETTHDAQLSYGDFLRIGCREQNSQKLLSMFRPIILNIIDYAIKVNDGQVRWYEPNERSPVPAME